MTTPTGFENSNSNLYQTIKSHVPQAGLFSFRCLGALAAAQAAEISTFPDPFAVNINEMGIITQTLTPFSILAPSEVLKELNSTSLNTLIRTGFCEQMYTVEGKLLTHNQIVDNLARILMGINIYSVHFELDTRKKLLEYLKTQAESNTELYNFYSFFPKKLKLPNGEFATPLRQLEIDFKNQLFLDLFWSQRDGGISSQRGVFFLGCVGILGHLIEQERIKMAQDKETAKLKEQNQVKLALPKITKQDFLLTQISMEEFWISLQTIRSYNFQIPTIAAIVSKFLWDNGLAEDINTDADKPHNNLNSFQRRFTTVLRSAAKVLDLPEYQEWLQRDASIDTTVFTGEWLIKALKGEALGFMFKHYAS